MRILSNPAFDPNALPLGAAMELLERNRKHPKHVFWPMDIGFNDAVGKFRRQLVGHQQVTDAYLLGIALHKGGGLATLDKSLVNLLPEDSPERARIAVISNT